MIAKLETMQAECNEAKNENEELKKAFGQINAEAGGMEKEVEMLRSQIQDCKKTNESLLNALNRSIASSNLRSNSIQ